MDKNWKQVRKNVSKHRQFYRTGGPDYKDHSITIFAILMHISVYLLYICF